MASSRLTYGTERTASKGRAHDSPASREIDHGPDHLNRPPRVGRQQPLGDVQERPPRGPAGQFHVVRRREKLLEAYVHDGSIARDLYSRQMSKLDEERSLLVLERQDAEGEQWDADGLLGFAEHLVMNARRMWDEAPVGYKQKFQRFVVPTGLEWDGERFGTVLTGWFYSQLRADFATGERMVDLTGVEPVTS